MRSRRTLCFSFFLALALVAAPRSLRAAEGTPKTPTDVIAKEGFEDTSQVLSVEVPVNVTGRDGQPVRGLTAADFEILDEGTQQPIRTFDVVDLAALASHPAANTGPAAKVRSAEQLESSIRRHFLLLFDLSFSNPIAILKARLAAREFLLHSLQPSDLAAVATFSIDTGPRLVVTFTPDRAQLARAIDTLGQRHLSAAVQHLDPLHFVTEAPVSGLLSGARGSTDSNSPLADLRAEAESALLDSLAAVGQVADRNQKSFERGKIKAFTRSMADMARALDSIKGRKHLIYFSEGFDSRLLLGRAPEGAENDAENQDILEGRHERVDTDSRYGSTELQKAVNDMLESFRRADCVIQAVDIGGLRPVTDVSGLARGTGQDGLFYLANETGGELFKDTNNLVQQLDRVLARTSVTYLLTFERSDLKPDGKYHRLKVKVNLPPGARASYRTGYYGPRPFRGLDPLERSLLAADGIASAVPRKDIDLSLLVAPFRASPQSAYVPVIIEVGGRSLLQGQAGDKVNIEVYTYVTDAKGEVKDFFTHVVGIDLGKARQAVLETGVKYYGHLDLAPGQYRVRVLVRNSDTGRTGIETAAVSVPTYASDQPNLLPPLFMDAPGRWLLVRERSQGEAPGQGEGSVIYPFTVNGMPYVPSARPELASAQKVQLCLVAYNMGAGLLALDGEVLAADGQVHPGGSLALVERTATGIKGVDKLLATFEPKDLPAGDYVLRVGVRNRETGSHRESTLPFVVN